MDEDAKAARQAAIEAAAYALLVEKGYAGMSMLAVAKRAKASNETLYNWYGDKRGLCRALVSRNAASARVVLEAGLAGEERPALAVLEDLGVPLLVLLLSEPAIALNRAAAADPSGELGAALAEAGREAIVPLIEQVMLRAQHEGVIRFDDPGGAVELYLSLLVGDLQIRRVIGQVAVLAPEACAGRAETALRRFLALMAA